ncbi:MAG TPA: universal stress protein [Gemmatimonadales bacterium]|jgi:nucleotide-binding universal stress UspA family protein
MFTRLLIGLDGSADADAALEQALVLGHRFGAKLVVAHVQEHGAWNGEQDSPILARARERVTGAGLEAEMALRRGDPDTELAALATEADAVLVGRRGGTSREGELGGTVSSLIKIAERCVIVCGATPSPMSACAIAFDGRETSRRALDLVMRFASIAQSTVHVIHASADRTTGLQVVGEAEAVLSLQGVVFVTHIEAGSPGEVVARVVARTKCDALFAGAHIAPGRTSKVTVSHAEEILRHTDIPVVIQP